MRPSLQFLSLAAIFAVAGFFIAAEAKADRDISTWPEGTIISFKVDGVIAGGSDNLDMFTISKQTPASDSDFFSDARVNKTYFQCSIKVDAAPADESVTGEIKLFVKNVSRTVDFGGGALKDGFWTKNGDYTRDTIFKTTAVYKIIPFKVLLNGQPIFSVNRIECEARTAAADSFDGKPHNYVSKMTYLFAPTTKDSYEALTRLLNHHVLISQDEFVKGSESINGAVTVPVHQIR